MGLTNTQYNTIMRDYQRQQAKNQQELTRRREEIYRRLPEFSEIDGQIASASTACARRLLAEDGTSQGASVENLKKTIAGLSARRGELLEAAGYPADYLTPVYRCPDCQDTGYIGQEKCHCFRQAIIDARPSVRR